MQINDHRGYVGAFGPTIDAMALKAAESSLPDAPPQPRKPYHITLIPRHEYPLLPTSFKLASFASTLENTISKIHPLGVGGIVKDGGRSVLFVVIVWNAAQQARKAIGLPPKQFHITLTNHDNHSIDKGVDSLLYNSFPADPTIELLDDLVLSLILEGRLDRAHYFAVELSARYPMSLKGFVRLGDIAMKRHVWKLAMLAYGRVLHLMIIAGDTRLEACLKRIAVCAQHTEWGHLFTEEEEYTIPYRCSEPLLEPWGPRVRELASDAWCDGTRPSLMIESRIHLRVPESPAPVELPRFFRWVVPFHFALMSTPRHSADIITLASPPIGIRHIITLTEETPLPSSWFDNTGVGHTHVAVANYHPPTIEQMDLILRMFEDDSKLPILVHCGGGKGRAGTVAACYIAAYGFAPPPRRSAEEGEVTEPAMSASQAIAALRAIRPGSLETQHQEDFVHRWISAVWKRRSILAPLIPEPPPTAPEITGKINATADLVVLIGLPGAGKSTFAEHLMARNDLWRRISQDDAGPGAGRSACEADIGRKRSGKVILDRCNPSAEDRKYWVSLAINWADYPVAIVFDYPADLCTSRAQQRPDHPTLPPGKRVTTAVQSMAKAMEMPTLAEGFVGIAIVRSFQAAEEVVKRLSPAGLFKFPRTPHLIDLGAATEDDIQTPLNRPQFPSFQAQQNYVIITEKIDGANMGISLSADRSVVVQNRSHYVNSASHEQFKKLDKWIEEHREGLYTVLDRDPTFPERYILFGEWLAATHSIAYTRLPDLFIAFDLYDRRTRSYVRHEHLQSLLTPTTIHLVPILWQGPESDMPDDAALRGMVQTPSSFYDGPVEGVYMKVESQRENKVLRRGKVVRGDFIAGNEHWTKGILKWNAVSRDDDEG